ALILFPRANRSSNCCEKALKSCSISDCCPIIDLLHLNVSKSERGSCAVDRDWYQHLSLTATGRLVLDPTGEDRCLAPNRNDAACPLQFACDQIIPALTWFDCWIPEDAPAL